jgi:hypothetical protein
MEPSAHLRRKWLVGMWTRIFTQSEGGEEYLRYGEARNYVYSTKYGEGVMVDGATAKGKETLPRREQATMYMNAYPPLYPPVDAQAQQYLHQFTARGIAAGAVLDDDLLEEARREYFFRKAALGCMHITPIEVRQSEMRMRAIEAKHIAAAYYGDQYGLIAAAVQQRLMPAVGVILHQLQVMNNNITNQIQAMGNQIQAADGRLQAVEGRLQAVEGHLHVIEDRVQGIIADTTDVRNMQRRAINHRVTQEMANNVAAQHALTPLVTRHGQYGNGILGMNPFQPPAGVPPGGEIPSPPFPATLAAIDAMTMEEIHELAVYANDDFGIVQADTLQQRHAKVRGFVLGV